MRSTRRLGLALALIATLVLPTGGSPAAADTPNACVANPEGGGKFSIHVNFAEFLNDGYSRLVLFDNRVNLVTSFQTHDCGNKTLDDVSRIEVLGTANNNWFMLDQSGGSFQNIEINLNLGDGFDWLRVDGTPERDYFYAIIKPIADTVYLLIGLAVIVTYYVTLDGVEAVGMNGLGGNDWMGSMKSPPTNRAEGAGGTYGPFTLPLTINGGPGKDGIAGGDANDTLIGGAGNDKLKGGKGKDKLNAGKGTDRCNGGPGKDKERGCE